VSNVRVLAALVPPVDAVRDLEAALALARPLVSDMQWTSPDDWHLTFAYFGNMSLSDAQRLDSTMRVLGHRLSPFQVHVEGVGTYPEPAHVDSLWAGVAPHDRLEQVSTQVLKAVEGFGWVLNRRVFRPQLLLGRSSRAPVNARSFIDRMNVYTGPVWMFDTLVLLQARSARDGAVDLDIHDVYPLLG
jgi:2'-5' RNA ligase